jgi:hypothetical protein
MSVGARLCRKKRCPFPALNEAVQAAGDHKAVDDRSAERGTGALSTGDPQGSPENCAVQKLNVLR